MGLTMAEIMILILFALLLIWMIGLKQHKQAEMRVAELLQQNSHLREQVVVLSGSPDKANEFDNLFRELELSKAEVAELKSKIASLEETSKVLQEISKEAGGGKLDEAAKDKIRQELDIAQHIVKATKGFKGTRELSDQQLTQIVDSIVKAKDSLEGQGLDISKAGSMLTEAQNKTDEVTARLKTLEGRLQNAQQRLAANGHGTEKPACWADSVTGKPEYIFDISLQPASVSIKDNKLPNRVQEESKLPIESIPFDAKMNLNDFRVRTRPLFDWSEKEGCRFFVRVIDQTAAHEKFRYKVVLRTVQEHFYTFEDLTGKSE